MWFWKNKLDENSYAIIGLGNPGPEYVGTRHNIGFAVIESLSIELGIGLKERKFQGVIGKGTVEDKKVFLVKPMTYMNRSGQCVSQIIKYYKIPLENILVIADDLDLELGNIRIRPSGGPGGHNGHKSISQSLGTKEYPRLRFGIGKPGDEEISDYVLNKFQRDELKIVDDTVKLSRDATCSFILDTLDNTMNHYNRKI